MSVVLLLARQRSGTGALVSVLERCNGIKYRGEVLDPSCELGSFFDWIKDTRTAATPFDFCEFFKDFIGELSTDDRINIVDIKYNSLNSFSPLFSSYAGVPWILDFFSTLPAPIIHIKRNILDAYVSAKLAEANAIYHTSEILSEDHARSVRIDIGEFASHWRCALAEDAIMDRFFSGYKFACSLDYEYLFDANGVTEPALAKISELLNLNLSELNRDPVFKKQAPVSLTEKISNINDVLSFLGSWRSS